MIILDSDGVMTDGKIIVHSDTTESKAFSIRDGFSILMARHFKLEFAVITGQLNPIIQNRAAYLGITEVLGGFINKADIAEELLNRHQIDWQQTAYMGDDLFDIPLLKKVELSAAPANATVEVLERVDWVSKYNGGNGAVRELVESILKAQGLWYEALKEFAGE